MVQGLDFANDNNDGILGANTSGRIKFSIVNKAGAGDAFGVAGKITVAEKIDLNVPSEVDVGDIKGGQEKKVSIPIRAGLDIPTGRATITIAFEEAGGFPPEGIKIKFNTSRFAAPNLALEGLTIDDGFYPQRPDKLSVGNGNGIIEPGESVEIAAKLVNRGAGPTDQTTVSIDCDVPGINMVKPPQRSAGNIAPGKWADLNFVLTVRKDFTSPKVPLRIHITDGVTRFNKEIPFELQIGKVYSKIAFKEVSALASNAQKPQMPSFGKELLPPPHSRTKNSDAVAVIIGIKNYKNPDVPSVDYALNDADAVREYAVETFGIDPDNIIIAADATKGTLERIFGTADNPKGQLYDYVKEGKSDIFVYYSGHGAPDQETQQAYLVPSDADPNYVRMNGYPLQLLFNNLNAISARQCMVILEACFSGNSEKGMLLTQASPLVLRINKLKMGSVNVFSSSANNQISSWYPEKQHGLFTYFFLKALQDAASKDKAGQTTTGSIRDYLLERIPPMARRLHGREQTPDFSGNADRILVRY